MTNLLATLNGSIIESNDNVAIDITDILTICKQYNILGWNLQGQLEYLIENGVEETVNNGKVSVEMLPYIRDFLKSITERLTNADVVDQAYAIIMMIDYYEFNYPKAFRSGN